MRRVINCYNTHLEDIAPKTKQPKQLQRKQTSANRTKEKHTKKEDHAVALRDDSMFPDTDVDDTKWEVEVERDEIETERERKVTTKAPHINDLGDTRAVWVDVRLQISPGSFQQDPINCQYSSLRHLQQREEEER